ncbi:MAG: c-type cytochrome [Bacteroidetes bacterium]|nr:c-type cytochrome [Bacteroidota bacterium]
MKRRLQPFILFTLLAGLIWSCGPKAEDNASLEKAANKKGGMTEEEQMIADGRGFGEVKSVTLTNPLDESRIKRGMEIYDMKCSACHRLDSTRLVGPGWAGLTKLRKPEWIMNMITNVDVMLEKDPEAQKLLQLCLTRMPNQNVSIGDARDVLEYMRSNDGEK